MVHFSDKVTLGIKIFLRSFENVALGCYNRKPQAGYRMVEVLMTPNDP